MDELKGLYGLYDTHKNTLKLIDGRYLYDDLELIKKIRDFYNAHEEDKWRYVIVDMYCRAKNQLMIQQLTINNNEYILDVRTEKEYQQGNIETSINIPIDELRDKLNEIPKNKKIYLYCQVGLRGYIAFKILKNNGYDVYNLSGGYKLYDFIK